MSLCVSPSSVDEFIETLGLMERQFASALRRAESSLKTTLGQDVKLLRIRGHNSITVSKIFAFLKMIGEKDSEDCKWAGLLPLEDFKRRYVQGALSFAAFILNDEPLVVVLAEATLYRTIFPRPTLVCADLNCDIRTIQMICWRVFTALSDLVGLAVTEDTGSNIKHNWYDIRDML